MSRLRRRAGESGEEVENGEEGGNGEAGESVAMEVDQSAQKRVSCLIRFFLILIACPRSGPLRPSRLKSKRFRLRGRSARYVRFVPCTC